MPRVGCLGCERSFETADGLLSHCLAKGHRMRRDLRTRSTSAVQANTQKKCNRCQQWFGSAQALRSHQDSKPRADGWCRRCSPWRRFDSPNALQVHVSKAHPECIQCGASFRSVGALISHCAAKGHLATVCRPCERAFDSLGSLERHLNSREHYTSPTALVRTPTRSTTTRRSVYWCASCNVQYNSERALQDHLTYSSRHNWCACCKKDFRTYDHRLRHTCTGRGGVGCFFCSRSFNAPSGLAHHLETGVHGVNRHQITAAVYQMNVIPNITVRTIEHRPSQVPPLVTYRVSNWTWNGYSYSCPLCRKTFHRLDSLKAHVNSAAHDRHQFQCPRRNCKRRFTLISGFIQHLESGCCGLAGAGEIARRFLQLNRQFTRALTW